jgi:hypothetical protein
MDSDLQAKKEEEDRMKRLGKVAEEYDKDFDNKLKNFQKPLEEIPVFWYDECVKRGYINEWKKGKRKPCGLRRRKWQRKKSLIQII